MAVIETLTFGCRSMVRMGRGGIARIDRYVPVRPTGDIVAPMRLDPVEPGFLTGDIL